VDILLDAFEEAFASDSEVCLILATTLYSKSEIEANLQRRRMRARVYGLAGRFSESELSAVFRASHAYVTASLGEGWNLPLCEAAACGLPVIAGRHTAHAEIFGNEEAYLFDPDGYASVPGAEQVSPWFAGQKFASFGRSAREQLVSHLKEVRDHYPDAQKRGNQASRMIRSRYTWQRSANDVLGRLSTT
jgi:glycosyltransferase involved in cell wall biosynthesis